MKSTLMTLDKVNVGETCTVDRLNMSGTMRRRLQDLGMIEGTKVTTKKKSPFNGPIAYTIRDSVYALRQEDAHRINVTLV